MKKEDKIDLKVILKPPQSMDTIVKYLPSVLHVHEIEFIKSDHPLYEARLKAWKLSINGDYGFQKPYAPGKPLKDYPLIPEIEFFVLVRKNWFKEEGPTSVTSFAIQQWAMKLLIDYLWKTVESFQTENLIGFAQAFKVAVEREDCSAYFQHDYFKVYRSWLILTVKSYTEETGKSGLLLLPKEEFNREIERWVPSSREILDDLQDNEGEAPLKISKQDYNRNGQIKRVLKKLGLPYRIEK